LISMSCAESFSCPRRFISCGRMFPKKGKFFPNRPAAAFILPFAPHLRAKRMRGRGRAAGVPPSSRSAFSRRSSRAISTAFVLGWRMPRARPQHRDRLPRKPPHRRRSKRAASGREKTLSAKMASSAFEGQAELQIKSET